MPDDTKESNTIVHPIKIYNNICRIDTTTAHNIL